MQWSNTLSNLAHCSVGLWNTTFFNPLKVLFWRTPLLCIVQANQSTNAWTGKYSKLLTLWFLLSWKHFPFFCIPSFPLFLRRRKKLFLVCEMLVAQLESSRPQPCGQYLRKTPSLCFFLSQQNAHLIGSLLPLKEKSPVEKYHLTIDWRLTSCISVFEQGIHWSIFLFPSCWMA